MRDEHILRAVFTEPWFIHPDKFLGLQAVVLRHARGERLPRAEIDAIVAANPRPAQRNSGNVAVLNVFGVIAQRMDLMMEFSGGVSTEALGAAIRQLVADDTIGAIVLNIDSPGGSVFGVDELATTIYQSRGTKPIVAIANSFAASAAYYIASQADEVVVTPTGQVGSIGVFTAHADLSAAYEAEGVKVTLIKAGKYKAEANDFTPLDPEARANLQAMVDTYYSMFTRAVARGRGVKQSDVENGMGQGRMALAHEAVRLGMADRIATLDETVARLQGGGRSRGGARAEESLADRLYEVFSAPEPLTDADADRFAALDALTI